jgi:outer membrane receptor protein involved in Fe transport
MTKLILRTATLAALLSSRTFAQEASQAAAPEAAPLNEIVVTGSRVVVDGTQAPTPVTVVSADQLQLASPGPIGVALNQLPEFRGSVGPQTGGVSSTGPNSGSFLNLRNLGTDRTLVLLDDRRAAPSAILGTTDTNLLPQELIKRVDIVTGGASAAYGSDAVSGVVNFMLDTDFQGLKGSLQGGTSTHNDAGSGKATLTAGTNFADNRGHVVFSGSYFDSSGINETDRTWSNEKWGLVPSASNPALLIHSPNVVGGSVTSGGVIVSPPFTGIQFGPGGVPKAYNSGTNNDFLNQIGGDGAWPYTNLQASVTTKSFFTHVKYDVTSSLQVFGEAGFAEAHNNYMQVQQYQVVGLSGLTMFSNNPYIPAALQQQMTALHVPGFVMGRLDTDLGPPATADALNDTYNVVAGVKFDAGGGWTVNGYYEHGDNRQRVDTLNNVNDEHLYAAADAVTDPATGSPVCRVTLTNPSLYPGCVPINLFGQGAPSKAAAAYVLGTSSYITKLHQDVVSASVRGEPFSTWAGPVALGGGAEYRREAVDQTSDAVSQQINSATDLPGLPATLAGGLGGWILTNAQPVAGSYNIKEAFFETLVPLAKDLPGARALDLNAAVRYADYSTSGGVTSWKAGLSWKPIADLRIRATRSRDIRAPNIAELYAGSLEGQSAIFDRQNNNASTPVITNQIGNPNLKPEIADTFTGGFIYQPSWLTGFSATVDYYNIDLKGAVSSLTAQQTVDECAAGAPRACANIQRNGAGTITRIDLPNLNLDALKTSGVDFELSYRTPVPFGNLHLRSIASFVDAFITEVPGAPSINYAGEVGRSPNPRWSGNVNATYEAGPFRAFLQERVIGPGKLDVTKITGVTIDNNNVEAIYYTDLTLGYAMGEKANYQAFLTINNLFNRDPPIAPNGSLIFFPTNTALYDVVGRYFTVGLKGKF